MAEIWLICEGSTDHSVISKMIDKVPGGANIALAPASGEKNLGPVAAYLRKKRGGTAAYIKDRDYAQRDEVEESYNNTKPKFFWRRHSIENYLIEPAVLIATFDRWQHTTADTPNGVPDWIDKLPRDPDTLKDALRDIARQLAPQEAAYMTIYRLRGDLFDSAGRMNIRDLKLSKDVTPNADAYRKALLEEAERLHTKAQETIDSPHLVPTALTKRYDEIVEKISAPQYVNNMKFLEEYHGKRLLKRLCQWLVKNFKYPKSRETLLTDATSVIADVYENDRLVFGTDDFSDLVRGIQHYADHVAQHGENKS